MSQTTITAALLAAFATPAAANPLAQLLNYTGQIRGQMSVVEAQTKATFDCVPSGRFIADDIYDELRDLCRDLDRLEDQIARPLTSRRSLRRLERLVERLDEQACEVQEAVHEALEDRRFRRHNDRRLVSYAPLQPVQTIPGVPNHVLRKLPPHVVEHVAAARLGRASRGSTVSIGRGRFQLTIGTQPALAHPGVGYTVARPIGLIGEPAAPNPAGAALCAEADRLRLMTKQLKAIVCH